MAKKKEVKIKEIKEVPAGGVKVRYAPITAFAVKMDKPFKINGHEYASGDYVIHGKGNGPKMWMHGMTAEAFKFFKVYGE